MDVLLGTLQLAFNPFLVVTRPVFPTSPALLRASFLNFLHVLQQAIAHFNEFLSFFLLAPPDQFFSNFRQPNSMFLLLQPSFLVHFASSSFAFSASFSHS